MGSQLPSHHELGHALTYTYNRLFEVCSDLAAYLGDKMDSSVPNPTSLDPTFNDVVRTRYIKIGKPGVGRSVSTRMNVDPNFQPPPQLTKLADELKAAGKPTTLAQTVSMLAKLAMVTFEHHGNHGNHVPMLLFFDDNWKQIDFLSTHFSDQADKFVFWRNAAEPAAYQRAYALVWIRESWIRDMSANEKLPIRELPIIGERLHVIGADITDNQEVVTWNIRRSDPSAKPVLEAVSGNDEFNAGGNIFFVKPVIAAMKAARAKSAG